MAWPMLWRGWHVWQRHDWYHRRMWRTRKNCDTKEEKTCWSITHTSNYRWETTCSCFSSQYIVNIPCIYSCYVFVFFFLLNELDTIILPNIMLINLISKWFTYNQSYTSDDLSTRIEQSQDLMLRWNVSFLIITYLALSILSIIFSSYLFTCLSFWWCMYVPFFLLMLCTCQLLSIFIICNSSAANQSHITLFILRIELY